MYAARAAALPLLLCQDNVAMALMAGTVAPGWLLFFKENHSTHYHWLDSKTCCNACHNCAMIVMLSSLYQYNADLLVLACCYHCHWLIVFSYITKYSETFAGSIARTAAMLPPLYHNPVAILPFLCWLWCCFHLVDCFFVHIFIDLGSLAVRQAVAMPLLQCCYYWCSFDVEYCRLLHGNTCFQCRYHNIMMLMLAAWYHGCWGCRLVLLL